MNNADNAAPFDEQHLSRLGLLHPPFADDDFRFEDADIEAARNLAVHLLQSSNRVVILSGPAGVGRTSLLRQIAATDPDELDCCMLGGSPQVRVANISKMLAMRMGASEVAHEPESLAARLRQEEASGYRPALLIDDAHRLEENTIKDLVLLREAIAKSGGRLPILLAAPTGADEALQRFTASVSEQNELSEIVLPAFTEAQTASYLDQSLAAAGEHTGRLLSARQKQQIHEQAGGIAASINQKTVRTLMDTSRKRKPLRFSLPRSWLLYAGAAAAVILLIGGLMLTNYLEGPETATAPPQGEPLALPSHPKATPADPTNRAEGVRSGGGETLTAQPPTRQPASPSSPEMPTEPSAVNSAPRIAQDTTTEAQQAPPQTAPSTAGPPLRQTPPAAEDTRESARTDTGAQGPAGPTDTQSANNAPADTVSNADTEKSRASPAITPEPSGQRPEAAQSTNLANRSPTSTGASPAHEDWLAERPGDHYTIQLIAGYKERTLKRFMEQYQVGGKAHVVQAQRQGRTWHVLVTGDYPTREAARNALNRLPRELRDNGIWVRSFASLQP